MADLMPTVPNQGERFNYHKYLASREWALLKRAVHERSGGKCERRHWVLVSERVEKPTWVAPPQAAVHHLTYERIGREELDDLLAVCQPCHDYLSGMTDHDPVQLTPTEHVDWICEVVRLMIASGWKVDARTATAATALFDAVKASC